MDLTSTASYGCNHSIMLPPGICLAHQPQEVKVANCISSSEKSCVSLNTMYQRDVSETSGHSISKTNVTCLGITAYTNVHTVN